MKFLATSVISLFFLALTASGANSPSFEATNAWFSKIENSAPSKPQTIPKQKRTALIFSLMTGYKHWCTPHTEGVVRILGEKSGAYDVVVSNDISNFEPENIKRFDVIVLNNNCSDKPARNMFYDVLQDMEKADALEKSLIDHIAAGNGLVALHGGLILLNNSDKFSEVVGGSFDFHPNQREVVGKLVDPEHPITRAFAGKPFVQNDEPYIFNRAYSDFNFHPLLEMEIEIDKNNPKDNRISKVVDSGLKRYIAWIKPHGKGRVFHCSPSHNAQTFEQPDFLQFLLNGIQYAAGDLDCDDRPITPHPAD